MEQQGKATDKTARARGYIVSLWPALPFMGFGFCAAWNALAQGTAWLSPIETNGTAITNLTMVINIATGVCLLVAGILGGRMTQILTDRRFTSAAGIVAALASLVLLLIGPAYFQQALSGASHTVFQICAVLIGLSFAVLYLRFGMLYARLPLRRAVLYLCYAHLLSIFAYLAVQASPMWAPLPKSPPMAFMIIFVVLPLFACATLGLDAAANPWTQREPEERPVAPAALTNLDLGSLRRPLVSFSVALFLFAFAQSAVTVAVVTAAPPASTLATSNADMLVRIPLVLTFALLASTLEARRLNFGRLLVILASLLEAVVLLGLVVGVDSTSWLVPVRDVVFGFQTLTWCMIFAVAGCHCNMSFTIVACTYGSSALGMGLGSLAGAQISETLGTPVLLVICALRCSLASCCSTTVAPRAFSPRIPKGQRRLKSFSARASRVALRARKATSDASLTTTPHSAVFRHAKPRRCAILWRDAATARLPRPWASPTTQRARTCATCSPSSTCTTVRPSLTW